ncbi:hypothetical protein PVK06_009012 [Gossypium arboreum]|uniref:Uncharacterized protein n=1 Tax=Gossypium arboreum TaxID=29729 RepID=A0ABR0QLJ2_GOSAR|nr:hypothetical protein PVK06_009012 [Gossypium arboreum]
MVLDLMCSEWIKRGNLAADDDDDYDDEGAFEHIPSPWHASPPTSSSYATQPSSEVNSAILDAIHLLSNYVRGLKDEVRSYREDVNTRLPTLEAQMASLVAHSLSTPPFSTSDD